MFTQNYRDYLKSEAWKKKRAQCFKIHGRRCKACFTRKPPIQIHHMDYTRLRREDPRRDIIPLCLTCHRIVTAIYRRNRRRGLRRVTLEYIQARRRQVLES